MIFQNCILINFERTDGRKDGQTDARTHGQVKISMPLQLFQSWGHKNNGSPIGICHLYEKAASLGCGPTILFLQRICSDVSFFKGAPFYTYAITGRPYHSTGPYF